MVKNPFRRESPEAAAAAQRKRALNASLYAVVVNDEPKGEIPSGPIVTRTLEMGELPEDLPGQYAALIEAAVQNGDIDLAEANRRYDQLSSTVQLGEASELQAAMGSLVQKLAPKDPQA